MAAAGIIAAFSAALSRDYFKKNIQKNSPLTITTIGFAVSTLIYLPLMAVTDPEVVLHPVRSIPAEALPGVLYSSLLASVVAFFSYETLAKKLLARQRAWLYYLQPGLTIPLAVLWLGEALTAPLLLGAGIIILGALLIKPLKRN